MKRALTLAVFTMIAAACGGGSSSAPASSLDLNSMIGMRASYLDSEMAENGYVNAGGWKEMDVSYTTWWNGSRSHCVQAATVNGKVESAQTVPASECQ